MQKAPRKSIITLAVAADEKRIIASRAAASNMTVSSYARLVLLDAHPITLELKRKAPTEE